MASQELPVFVTAGDAVLEGTLGIPDRPRGVVLFAHASGSNRHSPRNRYVASYLQSHGLATLLLDLLTVEEEEEERWTRHLRFDEDETEPSRRHLHLEVRTFADRLIGTSEWLQQNERTLALGIAYFGASTGAAAVLLAAARSPYPVEAVVSRGGRPDLAADHLRQVRAPTLLIVGGDDEPVIEKNREALGALGCEKELQIVPRATHLFEEPGALDAVAHLATAWYGNHLAASGRGS
jgi:putative phosphoribosyl transferase